jgi:hypothetical protein
MGDSADSCPGAGKALLLLGTDQAACASPGAALHDQQHVCVQKRGDRKYQEQALADSPSCAKLNH